MINNSNNLSINEFQIHPQIEQQQQAKYKMDRLCYESIMRLRRSYLLMGLYHMIKALIMIIFIPINYTIINSPNNQYIKAILILSLISSILQIISLLIFRFNTLNNNRLLLLIAQQLNHSSIQQPINNHNLPINIEINKKKKNTYIHTQYKNHRLQQSGCKKNIQNDTQINNNNIQINNINFKQTINRYQNIQQLVSVKIYNSQNNTLIDDEGLTQEIKNMYLNILTSNIKQITNKHSYIWKQYDSLAQFIGLSTFIINIIILSTQQSNTSQLTILIIYIVLQGLSKLLLLIIITLIVLSPLLCCFMLCICCCCSNQLGQLRLPVQQKATQQMIAQADGTCSICYQNFIVNQQVIRLTCSNKHMFHPLCISGWTKLKQTCPICRASIRDNRPNKPNNNNNNSNNIRQ